MMNAVNGLFHKKS